MVEMQDYIKTASKDEYCAYITKYDFSLNIVVVCEKCCNGRDCTVRRCLCTQLTWYTHTTCTYGLFNLSKPGCKVRDSSHRIIKLNILIVCPNHDAGPSSQFQLNFSKQTVFHVLNVHFRIIAQADGYH